MSRLSKYIQTPDEEKQYAIEYSDWLADSETLSSVTFTVTPTTSPAFSVPASSITTGDTGVNSLLKFFVSGGVDGNTYTVLVTVTTSIGQIKQDTVLFQVRAV